MSVFIRRKKRLFEADGDEQQQNQQPALQADAQQNNNQQSTEQAQPTELQQKVTACINNITEIVKKNDPYALIALDLPSMIQQQVPDFKADNATAKDAISAWDAFKQGANKDNFDKFMNAFATFGNGGPEAEKKQQEQQAQQQNALSNQLNQQQTANNAQTQPNQNQSAPAQTLNNANQPTDSQQQPSQNNTQDISNSLRLLTTHLKGESLNNKFRDMLKENLQTSLKKDRYEEILKDSWKDPESIFC